MYVMGAPLAVCVTLFPFTVSVPQLDGVPQVKDQSTPSLLGSLFTLAVKFSEKLILSVGAGSD